MTRETWARRTALKHCDTVSKDAKRSAGRNDSQPRWTRWARPLVLGALGVLMGQASGCGQLLGLDSYTSKPVVCAANSQEACIYPGPPGTENVGVCKAGIQTCEADGTSYSQCVGEVVPAAIDDCSTMLDEDCNGMVNDACVCKPGESISCYEGAMETAGVGICHPGTQVCNEDGLGYGPCTGQQLPQAEVCSVADDEDCDGFACSEPVWAKAFQTGAPAHVAVDSKNNIVVLGTFSLPLTIESTNLTSMGSNDLFLAKFSPNGELLWAKQYGDGGNQNTTYGLVIDSADNIVIAARADGTIDFGGTPLSVMSDGFVIAKLNSAGIHVWSRAFEGTAFTYCRAIAVDQNNAVVVTGTLGGSINFGNGLLTTAGNNDIFLAKLASDTGNALWSKRYGDGANQNVSDMAVNAAGSIFLFGTHEGTWNFGGPTAILSATGTDVYVAKLDGQGSGACSTTIDAGGNPMSIASDPTGGFAIAGTFSNAAPIDLGGGALTAVGNVDTYLARFQGTCEHDWSNRFGLTGTALFPSVTVDQKGNIVLTGQPNGEIDFGGGKFTPKSIAYDATLAKFDNTGKHQWSHMFGTVGTESNTNSAIGTSNEVVLIMSGGANIDLGTGQLGGGMVLAKFGP